MKSREAREKRNHGSNTRHLSNSRERNLGSFFKLMLPSPLYSKKLRIPEMFASTFSGVLSTTAIISVPTGESWKVALVKEDNQLWFQEGWQEFVEYFSIGFAYFLLFSYEGNYKFKVRIFNLTACEISYTCHACNSTNEHKEPYCTNPSAGAPFNHHKSGRFVRKNHGLDDYASTEALDASNYSHVDVIHIDSEDEPSVDVHEAQLDDDGGNIVNCGFSGSSQASDYEELGQYQGSKHRLHSAETNGAKRGTPSGAEDHVWYRDEGLMEALSSAGISKPENPFFTIAIKRYNLHKSQFVHIPAEFARDYIECEAGGFFKVEASDKRQWPVQFVRTSNCCTLGSGWIVFARENNLKVGDVCAFELTDARNHVLKVHVAKM